MGNVFLRIQNKCSELCEKLSSKALCFNLVIAVSLIVLIVFWFLFFPPLNNVDTLYIPGIEKSAIIEDAGDNWNFILDKSIITCPKNEVNPMYQAGEEVVIVTNKSEDTILNFCNYTIDGILVFDKDGQKIESASNIGYENFKEFEELKRLYEENIEIKSSEGYLFGQRALIYLLWTIAFAVTNVLLYYYSYKKMERAGG